MKLISHIRRSFTAQITLWVVGIAAVIMTVVLFLMLHFIRITDDGRWVMAVLTAVGGLVVLMFICQKVFNHYLHPLDMLATSAQRIADGKVNEPIPDTGHQDEIGQLQNSFAKMQRSLAEYIAEMQQKSDVLSQQNIELETAYNHAREADNTKAVFLSRMTDQMGQSVEAIDALTTQLCDHHTEFSKTDLMKIQIQMLTYTDTVTRLLDQMVSSTSLQSAMPSHPPLTTPYTSTK